MESKQAYEQKMQAKIDQWRSEMDRLKAKASEADADARIEYEKQMDNLKEKQKEAAARLNELRDAGSEAWDEMKSGVEKAARELGDAFASATEKLNK